MKMENSGRKNNTIKMVTSYLRNITMKMGNQMENGMNTKMETLSRKKCMLQENLLKTKRLEETNEYLEFTVYVTFIII